MDMPVYRLIDLARLLFFRALLLEAERRRDVSPSTSAHDTLQTARTHRRRAARRGRGVRPTGTPLSAHGFDSRQRAVDLRSMPDLCGQRARRGRLFAFDANGELIEAPTPAGDALFAKRAARSSRGAVPSAAEDLDASMWAVPFSERPMPSAAWDVHAAVRDVLAPAEDMPSLERAARSSRRSVPSAKGAAPSLTEIVSLDLLDSPFPERGVQSPKRSVPSAKGAAPSLTEIVSLDLVDSPFSERGVRSSRRSVPSAKRSVPSLEEIVSSDLLDSPFPERSVRSAKRSVPSKTGTLHTQAADRLLRRVSRHRAKGK